MPIKCINNISINCNIFSLQFYDIKEKFLLHYFSTEKSRKTKYKIINKRT